MRHTVTFSSHLDHRELCSLVKSTLAAGPFGDADPESDGTGTWNLTLAPRHDEMHIGFASVAECLLRLSKSVEVLAVTRVGAATFAVAS